MPGTVLCAAGTAILQTLSIFEPRALMPRQGLDVQGDRPDPRELGAVVVGKAGQLRECYSGQCPSWVSSTSFGEHRAGPPGSR